MNIEQPLPLLGGLSPQQFMKRHWQKKPLLVRQAIAQFAPLVPRARLLALAADDAVESRLVDQRQGRWRLLRGPLPRRSLPPLSQPGWTLLVQGMDLHDEAVQKLMQQFRFVPDARLDDVMISYATDGGGVGPHFDSYDVFLLQAHGRRRWRIGRQKDKTLLPDLPLRILANFQPEQEYLLEPGDMLYLPPGWAHDGVAEGECMTYSIGFRQPDRAELARELLQRLADEASDALGQVAYRDPDQPAVEQPAALPEAMCDFARDAVQRLLAQPHQLEMLLGELMTEPKPDVWFDALDTQPADDEAAAQLLQHGVRLDRRSRMLYDARHIFINGEGFRASGVDARLMRQLADTRQLPAAACRRLSAEAAELLAQWLQDGWVHADT